MPRSNVTAEKKARFLEEFKARGSVFHAAPAAGTTRVTVWRWMQSDPAFAASMSAMKYEAADALEDSLYERGMKSDTTAAIFWLKGNRKEKYGDTIKHQHGGDPTNPAPIRISSMTAIQPAEVSGGRDSH